MFKKFIRGLLGLIMLLCMAFTVSSCDYFRFGKTSTLLEEDSIMFAKQFKAIQNPEFKTVDEMISYVSDLKQSYTADSIFRTIPEENLKEIAGVVLKREGYLDKSMIVAEYKENYNKVYKYLPDKEKEETIDTTTSESKDTIYVSLHGKVHKLVK